MIMVSVVPRGNPRGPFLLPVSTSIHTPPTPLEMFPETNANRYPVLCATRFILFLGSLLTGLLLYFTIGMPLGEGNELQSKVSKTKMPDLPPTSTYETSQPCFWTETEHWECLISPVLFFPRSLFEIVNPPTVSDNMVTGQGQKEACQVLRLAGVRQY